MIPVRQAPEPPEFDAKVRRPGKAWLAKHPSESPRDYWTPIKPQLADGFRNLCAYAAMYEPVGTVDHFLSRSTNPELAYEWSNYRFASGLMNSIKKDSLVLDPHEIGEGWFEIDLLSLQLVPSDKVPPEKRELARETLRRLRLDHDERVIRWRQGWYDAYRKDEIRLEALWRFAPLIAAAVEKQNRERGRAARETLRAGGPPPASSPPSDKPSG